MVKAVILVKSSKKLIAAKIGKIDQIFESFPVSGQFDAVVSKLMIHDKGYCHKNTKKVECYEDRH